MDATEKNPPPTPATPVHDHHPYHILKSLSSKRKTLLLIVFCFSEFLDIFNSSAIIGAIPAISQKVGISNDNAVWLVSAYQVTFAALLLVSGRLSDLYDPKLVFMAGVVPMGIFALISGFMRKTIPLILLRGLMGIGAALTLPSATHLIVHMYPEPRHQANALAFFGASGAMANILGLVIGAFFVSYASWPWVYYFITIVAFSIGFMVFVFVPHVETQRLSVAEQIHRLKRVDFIGVGIITPSIILFVFAMTSGSTDGWTSAKVLAPLIISILMVVAFFVYEAKIPANMASVPPSTWSYPDISIIIAEALVPFAFWATILFIFSWLWQEVYGWSTIITAVHFLPFGASALFCIIMTQACSGMLSLKNFLLLGNVLVIAGLILLSFANARDRYWSCAFPGLILGSGGAGVVFVSVNISAFAVTPPRIAGMIGAILNCSLQLGSATVVSIATSIQTSVQLKKGGPNGFQGRAASIYFIIAFMALLGIIVLIFMKNIVVSPPHGGEESQEGSNTNTLVRATSSHTLGTSGTFELEAEAELKKAPNVNVTQEEV